MRPRTLAVLALAAALLTAAGCSSDSDSGARPATGSGTSTAGAGSAPAEPPAEPPSTPVPEAPAGTRWQGANGVVVAVPEGWATTTDPCLSLEGSVVHYLSGRGLAMRCALVVPGRAGSVLRVAASPATRRALAGGLPLRTDIGGVEVRSSQTRCRLGSRGPCTLTFAVPSAGVAFQVGYRGPRPSRFVERLRASVTVLPAGHVTVPVIAYGASSEATVSRLEAAGLAAQAPDVDFPHYVTGTIPAAGTAVPAGSAVELEIGDG